MLTISKTNLSLNNDAVAYSYRWYKLSGYYSIKGKRQLVLNNYPYSSTTIKHIAQVRRAFIMSNLDWIELPFPDGLPETNHTGRLTEDKAREAKSYLSDKVTHLLSAISKPKSRTSTNARRGEEIKEYKDMMECIGSMEV